MQEAFETVDSARAHKFELKERLQQLGNCISQVTVTSDQCIKEIQSNFSKLENEIMILLKKQSQDLINKINFIKSAALEPLYECNSIIKEGITEAESVIINGEKLLQQGDKVQNTKYEKELKKFNESSKSMSLDSVPEVPLTSEVVCMNAIFKSSLLKDISTHIEKYATISEQAPAQIDELIPRPGAILVTWKEIDEDLYETWTDSGNTVFYKLQYCAKKLNIYESYTQHDNKNKLFKDEYIGKKQHCSVNKLLPNTAYTFRVSRCLVRGKKLTLEQDWSPWSVYTVGMTMISGYEWLKSNGNDGYAISDLDRIAEKVTNSKQILFSKENSYLLGYPISFSILAEGCGKNSSDGFALTHCNELTPISIQNKETICFTSEGKIFVNGNESHTRFSNLRKGTTVCFEAAKVVKTDGPLSNLHKRITTIRVTITVKNKEAVFDWHIPSTSLRKISGQLCLSFASSFQSPGWKFAVA